MDKQLILSVAGSGKTKYLIDKLNLNSWFLIITYTNNNFFNIKLRVIEKFGFLPENIRIFTYFSFLYSFCFRPFLARQLKVKGVSYEVCPYVKASGRARYIDNFGRAYSNRLAKLINVEKATDGLIERLNKYFDVVMIDEIQDFAAHDFNFLAHIVKSNNDVFFVGDFFQHTFDTSRDGNTRQNLHNNYEKYIKECKNFGLTIDATTLDGSYRCSPTICNYVSSNLGINIISKRMDETEIKFLDSEDDILEICNDDDVIKLFYKNSSSYEIYSNNWGNSKGIDSYHDVCVVLNPTTFSKYQNNSLSSLNEQTKNKLYVAITRCRGNLFFVEEKLVKHLKTKLKSRKISF